MAQDVSQMEIRELPLPESCHYLELKVAFVLLPEEPTPLIDLLNYKESALI
jgi:hypothetical protein